ncbi:DUF1405 domain-containing protein [Paenibacillus sp. NFR01]|uniref:DUF1405 domain-containing protein n=1 Tax=Paenibacillus sp. NFR01 TaxID=1566279 RepID=UPI0008C2EDCD|nr:DUF1405 domain-containing protein [Paenibacillus sp. NFR01]SET51807.1 Uncharacterized membrane protein YpjA [Paenibacillus sp. NFR01]
MPVDWFGKLLKHRGVIWALIIANAAGTVYGYIWYGNQLEFTARNYALWLLPFVPDSPTASLFFTAALLLVLYPPKSLNGTMLQGLIEALAVVTSVKYGVWAVSIIFAGGYQGEAISWQDWMLVASHLAMAVEALLYARFFAYRRMLVLALLWTFSNDIIDYSFGIFPWLPDALDDNVIQVQNFTFILTAFSTAMAWVFGGTSRPGKLPGRRLSTR